MVSQTVKTPLHCPFGKHVRFCVPNMRLFLLHVNKEISPTLTPSIRLTYPFVVMMLVIGFPQVTAET